MGAGKMLRTTAGAEEAYRTNQEIIINSSARPRTVPAFLRDNKAETSNASVSRLSSIAEISQ
jgi:hypothetical protein